MKVSLTVEEARKLYKEGSLAFLGKGLIIRRVRGKYYGYQWAYGLDRYIHPFESCITDKEFESARKTHGDPWQK